MLNDVCNAGQLVIADSCPAQWISYSTYCYYVSGAGVTVDWTTARSHCQAMNTDLVSINDTDENQFVYSIS